MCKRLFILFTSFVFVLSLVSTASAQPTGEILFEFWYDIGGTAVSDLTSIAAYPDSPDASELRPSFDGPLDTADNYGSRARGFVYPPADGDYTFWISGDDFEELYLSTDDDPANIALIAEVPGWTSYLEWDKYPEQMSAPITLVGGQKYYIESIMKEGGGGDSMTVGWTGPEIGEEIAIVDGAFLSPVLRPAARGPVPADGTIDYDGGSLEWSAGDGAVLHKVYLSTDAAIDDADLAAETDLTIHLAALEPGMMYYWRVDEVDADGAITEGSLWSFSTLPLEAHFPNPEDGAKEVESGTILSWTAGKGVIMHDVYFGTDEALVAASDPSTFKGKVMVASFDPGVLELFTTYYWKVDEFSVTGTNPGPVWSFSSPEFIIILGDETALDHDNTADPFVSELALDVPADLRKGGIGDLTLMFQGAASSGVSIDEATGTYMVTGNGHDIWDDADDFHYAYRELNGDATMVARVVDNGTGSNNWAKGGVMIRQSTEGGSVHAMSVITGGDGAGAGFQWRAAADGGSDSIHGVEPAKAPPYWVKIERVGNDFIGSFSPDGIEWTEQGTTTIEMTDPVLIGLCVTSHATGELRTFTFDNVDIAGDVSADTMNMDVGDDPGGNDPAPIYVRLEDSTGASATVTHGNPAATNIESWREWTIPLDKFEGVDATSAAKLYIGVGDGQPDGTGTVLIDDVFIVKPAGAGNIIWVSGFYDDKPDGIPDDIEWVELLTAAGHNVDYTPGWEELDDAKIAALNAADLIIVSRNSNSGDFDDGDEVQQWNAITTPIILSSTHIVRSSRWRWVDSTSTLNIAPAVMELADGTQIPGINEAVGPTTFIDAVVGNGTVLATGDGLPWIFEFEAGVEYYEGSGEIAGGPRVFFAAGTQETAPDIGRGEMNLSPEALAVFMATVDRLLPAASMDVTVPGDIVQGVPNDGDWPGGEHPALAIDDDTGTKYLHFKGEEGITGIQVSPLDGPSIVSGLALTTANDCAGRDPISFELSGSNGSIDGPYELIASGDVVDFAMEEEWPRFTKNETPIMFDNIKAYSHYQIIFTAIRGPLGGCVDHMQIAEVELLGVLAAEGPVAASYEFEGDAADVSGNGLNGMIMGDPMFVDGALQLDGVDDYVDLGNPSSLDFGTGDFAIAAWINMTAIERGTVYAKGSDNSGGIRYTLAMGESNDNKMTLTTDDNSTKAQARGDTVVNDGAWHHVVGMRKGNMSLVYVDGAFDGSIELPEGYDLSGSSQANAYIGVIDGDADPAVVTLEKLFAGLIDDVQVYNRALSDDEVAKLAGVPENILANGGFEDGVPDPWTTYGDASMEVVQVDPVEGDNCLHVTVGSAGANFWDAGLQHAGHVFDAGKSYALSIWFKSNSGPFQINMKPERGANPWEGYGSQEITITEEWAEYTVDTGVIPDTVDPASITFHIAYAAGDFFVDDAKFYEVE